MSVIYSFAALAMAQAPVTQPVPVPPPSARAPVDYDFSCNMIDDKNKNYKLTGSIRENPAANRYQRKGQVSVQSDRKDLPQVSIKESDIYSQPFGAEVRLNHPSGDFLYTIKFSTPDIAGGTTGVVAISRRNFMTPKSAAEYVGVGWCAMSEAKIK